MKAVLASHYTRTAVALHWLIAGFVLAALFMGWTMTSMEISPGKLKLYNYHKWLGVSVLSLALLRICWRLTHQAPPLEIMPRWQQISAHVGHGLLYLLMVAMPLSGWAYSNASGYPIVYLGKVPLPDIVGKDKELAGQLVQVHEVLAITFAALVLLHVLAVLQHHFIHRDRTLRRMLSWQGPGLKERKQ
ncbi:MAG: cytochrome b [Steroidobacteraceae bacterium]